jgi:hypothetical protein
MTTLDQLVHDHRGRPAVEFSWKHLVLGATAAGLVSGLRIYVTYNALGAAVSFADAIASGLMDWWLWIPFIPLVFGLARRFEPSHARPVRVVAVHVAAGAFISFGQLALFSAMSGGVRTLRFGDGFRIDLTSPLITSLTPGFIAYLGLVVLTWWIAGRREPQGEHALVDDPGASDREPQLTFRSGKNRVLLRRAEIEWVAAAGNYLELHVGADTHLVRETMKAVHARLGTELFVRVHRSSLVRRDAIVTVRTSREGAYVVLRDGTRLPVGRRYRDELSELVP